MSQSDESSELEDHAGIFSSRVGYSVIGVQEEVCCVVCADRLHVLCSVCCHVYTVANFALPFFFARPLIREGG